MIKSIDYQPAAAVYNKWTEGALSPFLNGGHILSAHSIPACGPGGRHRRSAIPSLDSSRTNLDDGTIALFAEAPQGTRLELFRGVKVHSQPGPAGCRSRRR